MGNYFVLSTFVSGKSLEAGEKEALLAGTEFLGFFVAQHNLEI